jgi:hypothetical protein
MSRRPKFNPRPEKASQRVGKSRARGLPKRLLPTGASAGLSCGAEPIAHGNTRPAAPPMPDVNARHKRLQR